MPSRLNTYTYVLRGMCAGDEVSDIEITIDVEDLARKLGATAMKSKGQRARTAGGMVRVKAVRKK